MSAVYHLCLSFTGGHTTEIIRLMGSLSQSYAPRHYVMADTDKMSEDKIRTFEASKEKSNTEAQVTWIIIIGIKELPYSYWLPPFLSILPVLAS